jgi:hypothetical protein
MACHGATKVSPYQLVYGHDVVLPWELRAGFMRTSLQDQLSADDYLAMMKEELEDLLGNRLRALENIEKNKRRVARWYDKNVKGKEFAKGSLVWMFILSIALGILNMGSGHMIGKNHIGSVNAYWQCIYIGDIGRREVYQGIEREILKDILSKHMGRRLVQSEPKSGRFKTQVTADRGRNSL